MIGRVYGRLTVIAASSPTVYDCGSVHKHWLCRCECGVEKSVSQNKLRQGKTISCGCAKSALTRQRHAAFRGPNFWARVDKRGDDECWEWIGGSVHPQHGYAYVGYEGRRYRSHRLAYELTMGQVPSHLSVLHRCDNKLCCNPKHLYVGTHEDNMRDMTERSRRININTGVANRGSTGKLSRHEFDEIKVRYAAGGVTQRTLAEEYGISTDYASKITRGVRFRSN